MKKELFEILDEKKIFKLVLGLGNQSVDEIKRLSAIYGAAGCDMFDVNASEKAIEAVFEGLGSVGIKNPLICISIGVEGDAHLKKAVVDPKKCKGCLKCIKMCPQDALILRENKAFVIKEKCIGCKRCKCRAVSYIDQTSDINNAVLLSKKYNAACVELHVSSKKPPVKEIKFLLSNLDCALSICLDRKYYGNEKLKKLILKVIKLNGSSKFIVQADGVPMSGGDDTFASTLQAAAMAHLIKDFGTYIFISGGTNSKTASLAKLCDLNYHGISVGSYARKIVKNLSFEDAVKSATELVFACKDITK